MATTTRILLPSAVRMKDVAKCLGILAGLRPHREDGFFEVRGVQIHSQGDVTCKFEITGRLLNGERSLSVMYFLESEGGDYRLLLPPSTTLWVTLGKGLVDFFGGKVIYQGHNRNKFYSRKSKSPKFLVHLDIPTNKQFYRQLERLPSLTSWDMRRNRGLAAE